MSGDRYVPGKPCEYGNEYCQWHRVPKPLEIIESGKRDGIRTAVQATLKIYTWRLRFFDRRLKVNTAPLVPVCEKHHASLEDWFESDIEPIDIRESMRSEVYLVDRTFL